MDFMIAQEKPKFEQQIASLRDFFVFLTAPVFSRPLLNQTAEVGGKINFKCYVSGPPKPDIKWYKNGKIIINKSGLVNIIDRYVLYVCTVPLLDVTKVTSNRYILAVG